jgi:hypothetical protein
VTAPYPRRYALPGLLGLMALALVVPDVAHGQLAQKKVLTLEAARHVVSAAEEEARRNGWPCVLAVVDDGGWLVLLERMDGAPMLASVELAPGKARAAAVYRKPTRALEESINGGRRPSPRPASSRCRAASRSWPGARSWGRSGYRPTRQRTTSRSPRQAPAPSRRRACGDGTGAASARGGPWCTGQPDGCA